MYTDSKTHTIINHLSVYKSVHFWTKNAHIYTVKKVSDFPIPSSLTKLSLDGNNLFPAREGLVSDIPAGDRNIAYLFYSV
jgi:hypothetical protein